MVLVAFVRNEGKGSVEHSTSNGYLLTLVRPVTPNTPAHGSILKLFEHSDGFGTGYKLILQVGATYNPHYSLFYDTNMAYPLNSSSFSRSSISSSDTVAMNSTPPLLFRGKMAQ